MNKTAFEVWYILRRIDLPAH